MKIIGINCSPRKGQTTQKSLEACLKAVHNESGDIETDIIELADLDIRGCLGCGYLFDSKVLVADAFHSGADLLAIFASGFGLWVASRKKTEKFPYGLYKVETLVTLIHGRQRRSVYL